MNPEDELAEMIERCPEHGNRTEAWPECRCAAAREAVVWPAAHNPAARLREAAALIRKRAADATPGPWRPADTHLGRYGYAATVLSGQGNATDLRAWLPSMSHEPWDETRNVWADATWIALMHPGIGEALATWLEYVADMAVSVTKHRPDAATTAAPWLAPALALADAILGEVTR